MGFGHADLVEVALAVNDRRDRVADDLRIGLGHPCGFPSDVRLQRVGTRGFVVRDLRQAYVDEPSSRVHFDPL